jgi:hypothetical protein
VIRRSLPVQLVLVPVLALSLLAVSPASGQVADDAERVTLGSTPHSPTPESLTLAQLCRAVGGSSQICGVLDDDDVLTAESFPGVRTVPDLACAEEYVGQAALIVNPFPFTFIPEEHTGAGGGVAAPEVAAQLPDSIHLKGTRETFTHEYDFATLDGRIYTRPRFPEADEDHRWHEVLLPRCLHGRVTEISADGFMLIATNGEREVYSLDYGRSSGWTRRWGPFFWTDMGAALPGDVTDWDASELHSGFDRYFVDRAGRQQGFWGILMLYLLRGDGTRITYIDPWLPVDQSREVCPPERGTVVMSGLSASGSTVMVVTSEGHVYTRLYDFDISGANTVLHDYSWYDQDHLDDPLIQLPAPDWIRHPDVGGAVTDRVSIRKVSPGTEHRIMRIEGVDRSGQTGYWEKDIAELRRSGWRFVRTGEPLRGELLPTDGPHEHEPEDIAFTGTVDGHPARISAFNPYCSPTTLEIDFADDTLELVLHSVDGLRQERRGRGLDLYPRHYRSAIEVPREVWERRDELAEDVRQFLDTRFEERFIDGPLYATLTHVQIQTPCWDFFRSHDDLRDAIAQPPLPDAGTLAAESPLLSEAVPQIIRGNPQLEPLLGAMDDETLGLGLRTCPPSLPPVP